MKLERGKYGQIDLNQLNPRTRKQVLNLFHEAQKSEKVDEHGAWEFGAEFDKHGRGSALNWDLYAIGKDYFSKRLLIIIQIRQFVKQRKGYYPQIRKSYFLLGRNEDDTAFAHPCESRVIHSAIKKGLDPIIKIQNWIFKTDYTKILRQGDVALVPMIRATHLREQTPVSNDMLIEGSHYLQGEIFASDTTIYVKNPSLFHRPQTHPDFENLKGYWKVILGKRTNFYDFAAPTID